VLEERREAGTGRPDPDSTIAATIIDIRQIPRDFEPRIALSIVFGNGKLPSSRARGDRTRRLTAPQR
jgi:hypothetical protein